MVKTLKYCINELTCARCEKNIMWTGQRSLYQFKTRIDGKVVYFCGESCKRHFLDDLSIKRDNQKKWKAWKLQQKKEKKNETK